MSALPVTVANSNHAGFVNGEGYQLVPSWAELRRRDRCQDVQEILIGQIMRKVGSNQVSLLDEANKADEATERRPPSLEHFAL
jgi:hypothetical protein